MNHTVFFIIMSFSLISCENKSNQTDAKQPAAAVMPAGPSAETPTTPQKAEGTLAIKDLKLGKGEEAKQNQTLRVNYKAFYESGVLFDSTEKRGKPFSFTLGEGTVIKGWEEGVKGMKVGSLRRLSIPPHLAYGEKGISGLIPPGSTLVFEIELLAIEGP